MSLDNIISSFGYSDYSIFAFMLFSSLGIGLYFSRKKQKNNEEDDSEGLNYLVGNRKLSLLPVSVSLIATAISGAGMIGFSTEVYLYGYHLLFNVFSHIPVGLLTHYCFLPVLYNMKLVSIYEYLDQRFDQKLRWICSILFLFNAVLKIPIQTFIASATLNQMTGLDIEFIGWIASVICIAYTCVGGMKAVIWTDVLQMSLVFGTFILLGTRGTILSGGFTSVLEKLTNTTRIEAPIYDFDPTIRLNFWAIFIGGIPYVLSITIIDQSMVQRFVSLPTLQKAKQAVWINFIGNVLALILGVYLGFVLYAYFHGCDPLSLGLVNQKDQLLPFFAMQTLGQYPFLCGIFVAGVFSAALSSMSSWLNSTAAIVLEDIVKPLYPRRLSERSTSFVLKGSVLLFGLISATLIPVIQKLSHVVVLVVSLHSITSGPVVAVFIIGMFMPWVGSKPTFCAVICGFILTGVIIFKTQYDLMNGTLAYQTKTFLVEQCPNGFNGTALDPGVDSEREFYHLSFMHHCSFGTLITILIANGFCLIFGRLQRNELNLNLLAPPIKRLMENQDVRLIEMKEVTDRNKSERTYKPSS